MKIRVFVSISVFFITVFSLGFSLFQPGIPAQAASDTCSFNSGTNYNLGDTTNATSGQAGFNVDEFYNLQNYYSFNSNTSDLDISSSKFSPSQADGNGYDMYPKLASVIGFIPSKLNNAYYLKHKTKNESQLPNPIAEVVITPGSDIKVPDSGYRILNGTDLAGMLMWTDGNSFVFQIGRADNPRNIFLYVFDVCVDQSLVTAYNKGHTAGRSQLPELHIGQVIAKAKSNTIRLSFRDNGVFTDPRSPYIWDTKYQSSLTNKTTYSGYQLITTTATTVPNAGGSGGGDQTPPTSSSYNVKVILDDSTNRQLQTLFFSNQNLLYPSTPSISVLIRNQSGSIHQTIDASPTGYTTGSQLSWSIPIVVGPQDDTVFTAQATIGYSKETAVNLCQDTCKSTTVTFSSDTLSPVLTIPLSKPFPITYAFSVPNSNTTLKDFFSSLSSDASLAVCFLTTKCVPATIDSSTGQNNTSVYVVSITDTTITQYSSQQRSELNCFLTKGKKYCYR